MKQVTIFTDGACSGNPGPGGWGAILRYRGIERAISGGAAETTNNRMELTAVLQAFSLLKEPCEVTLCSDSKYVMDGLSKGWAESWRRNGWRKSDKKPALNADLWQQLLEVIRPHRIHYQWIKGHAGHPENERCDAMAVAESQKFRGQNA
ncbi:MAG TPA: ribonuclease HI [Candidatus Pygmaiobacter gallistercoris]|nr:ribonuclease HI [Candidatus Pygmaiobacter gallistercoris]